MLWHGSKRSFFFLMIFCTFAGELRERGKCKKVNNNSCVSFCCVYIFTTLIIILQEEEGSGYGLWSQVDRWDWSAVDRCDNAPVTSLLCQYKIQIIPR